MDLEFKAPSKNNIFFLWLVIREVLPTCDFLSTRMIDIPIGCHLCNQSIKNVEHVFKNYPFIRSIKDRIKYNCPTPLLYEGDFFCDVPFPGGPIDHYQLAENLCVSYHETHT